MWASSQGRVDTVATLLEHGADVNALDGDRMSALMWAAGSEARDQSHMRGMLEKPSKGSTDVVQLLLRYGALVDMRDRDESALDVCVLPRTCGSCFRFVKRWGRCRLQK